VNLNPSLPPHLQRGAEIETLALQHLQSNGLQLLERNYRCPVGELDLVMLQQQELVFVEVRYRRSNQFGGPAQSIHAGKQRKLRLAAESFLQRHPAMTYSGCRFDVVAVTGVAPDYQIDWISDAF